MFVSVYFVLLFIFTLSAMPCLHATVTKIFPKLKSIKFILSSNMLYCISGAKGTGGERNTLRKKLKRKEGSPLLEMPDLSQSQKISAQDSHGSSDCLSAPLGSPQVG